MTILVTGAAGFLGQRVIQMLLADSGAGENRVIAADLSPCPLQDARLSTHAGAVENPGFLREVVEPDVSAVFHLAAVLSGQSEAEFDTAMRVNADGTRALLDACRALPRPPRFVFSSTIAALGGQLPSTVRDTQIVEPESTYGVTKAIGELLVSEYTRRGFVEGVSCRVPTVAIRPGRPNSALSSFVSGIVREPAGGVPSVCPVPLDTRLWISSPDVAVSNLVHAARMPSTALGARRAVNLPGLSVTPADLLDSLERLVGPGARALVRLEIDERTARIVGSWPGAFDVTRALALGFSIDRDVDAIVSQFLSLPGAA